MIGRVLDRLRGRPYGALLIATAVLGTGQLATHAPFAVYSPDVSFHLAKTLRASEGDLFTDPFSGTPSIYPSLFHAVFGLVQASSGWNALEMARFILVAHFLGLLGAAYLLSRVALRDAEAAALATLGVALVFYAPSGRHVLSESPGNLSTVLVVAGTALLLRSLGTDRITERAAGLALLGAAVNVVWYDAVPVTAVLSVVLFSTGPPRRWRDGAVAAASFLAPFAFTAWHFFSIRDVLPDYAGHVAAQIGPGGGVVREWLAVLVTRGNFRFEPLLQRSALAQAHYYLAALPAGVAVVAFSTFAFFRWPRHERDVLWRLSVAALLTFGLSFLLALTRDVPRLAKVQFLGYILLLPVAVGILRERRPAAARLLGPVLAAGALLSFFYTLRFTDRPFSAEIPQTTRAVVEYLRSIPDHRRTRVFVAQKNLRQLALFVTFRSFVNHSSGRYYSQDPVSSGRLLEAHATILERRPGWEEALRTTEVRFLALQHAEGGEEAEAARFYLTLGRPVVANRDWWVIPIR